MVRKTGRRSEGYENHLVILLSLVGGIVFYERAVISYLFPVIVPELGLQMWQVGLIAAALPLSREMSGWILGTMSARLGRKAVLVLAILTYSVLSWVTGVAISFVHVIAARIVVGMALGPVEPISVAVMVEESTPARRGINLGATGFLGYLVGFAVAPALAVHLASTVGWRWSFFLAAIPGLIVGLALWKSLLESPLTSAGKPLSVGGGWQPSKSGYLEPFRFRNVWVASVLYTLMTMFTDIFLVFGALYLTVEKGLPLGFVGSAMAILGVGACIGVMVIPAVSDVIGRKPAMGIATGSMGILLLALMAAGDNAWALMAVLFGVGLCRGVPRVLVTTVAESVPVDLAASAVGACSLIGTVLGTVLMPILTGILADSFGLALSIVVAAIAGVAGAFTCLLLTETAPRSGVGVRNFGAVETRL